MSKYIRKNRIIVNICEDNQGALALVKNPHLYEQSKHIDVYYYYIHDLVKKQRLKIEYVPIIEILADSLTKLLA